MESNQPADVETHKRLLFAIVEYLHSLGEGDAAVQLGFQVDNISIAEDLLSHVSGLSLANPEHVAKYSIKPMSLTNIFGLGLARKEQLEQAIGHLNKAEETSQVPAPKRQDYGFNDPNLEEKFRAYLELIRSRGYFNGVEENTPAYQERVENAKKRFAARYAQENPQENVSQNVTPVNTTPAPLSDEERLKLAEQHKVEGNERLTSKKYQEAIVSYSKAIELNQSNAIYYSNRAAAYSHIGQHHKAIEDCKQAIKIDPLYVKAYSRLGLAYFSLGKYKEAVEQGYKKALEIEPSNTAVKESLSAAEAKIREQQNVSPMPNMGGMGGMPAVPNMGGMGGMPNMGGMPGANPAAGGMPDLGAMMNDPAMQNAFQNFAQNLGQGGGGMGGMAGLLNNPAIQQMMNSPAVQQMMNNPGMMNMMMQQMMNNPQIMNIAQNLAQNPDVQNMINQQQQPGNPDGQQ